MQHSDDKYILFYANTKHRMHYFKNLFTHTLFSFKHLFKYILFNNTAANGEGIYSFNRRFIINRRKANAGLAYFKVLP